MKFVRVIFPPGDFKVELSATYNFRKYIAEYPEAIPLLFRGDRVWHVPGENPEYSGFTQFPLGEDTLLEEIETARKGGTIKYEV